MSTLMDYKCPCCGGAIEFNTSVQKMKCPYCDTEFEMEALLAKDEALNNMQPDSASWESENSGATFREDEAGGMKVYVCNSCGGEIVADETTAAPSCPYCDNPVVIKGNFAGELKPDIVIPFKLDKKAAKEALKNHINSKKFIPKIFKDENHIDEIKGVYVPHWLFNCDADAQISYKGDIIRTWSDSKYNYTETSVYDIYRSGRIKIDSLPVDGSTKMDDDLMESIEPFDVSQAVDFQTAYLAGYLADKYDVSADESIERANERIKVSAEEAFKSTVDSVYTGVHAENSSMNVQNGSYRYALYPVWLLNTSWNGQKFTFAMNGQTGKFVGDLPLDKSAFWKAVAALSVGLGGLIYAVMWLIALL